MFSSPVLSLSLARARCVTVFAQKSFDVRREDTIILLVARSLFEFFCSPFCSSFVVRVQTKKKKREKKKRRCAFDSCFVHVQYSIIVFQHREE